jgi:hypothetical protein
MEIVNTSWIFNLDKIWKFWSSGNNIWFWRRGSYMDMLGTWCSCELWYEVFTCNKVHNFTTTYVMNINPNPNSNIVAGASANVSQDCFDGVNKIFRFHLNGKSMTYWQFPGFLH